ISIGSPESQVEESPEAHPLPIPPAETAHPAPLSAEELGAHEDYVLVELGHDEWISPLADVSAEAQRKAIIRALRLCDGNKMEAANGFNISMNTLYNRLTEIEIGVSTRVEGHRQP